MSTNGDLGYGKAVGKIKRKYWMSDYDVETANRRISGFTKYSSGEVYLGDGKWVSPYYSIDSAGNKVDDDGWIIATKEQVVNN